MIKKKFSLLLALVVMISMSGALGACGNKDTGTGPAAGGPPEKSAAPAKSAAAHTPQRVVAGTDSIAQMLDVLQFDQVVGVPSSHYALPARYKNTQKIGFPMKPDIEKVKALNPDLFITVSPLKASYEKNLDDQGIKPLFLNTDSYAGFLNAMTELGKAVGKEKEAAAFVTRTRGKTEAIIQSVAGKTSPKVLFIFGSPKSMMVGTKSSYVGSLLTALKIHNVADDMGPLKGAYVPLNLENVVKAKPDLIICMTHAAPETAAKMLNKEFSENAIWKDMAAVKNGKVSYLDTKIFSVTGNVYLPEALETLKTLAYK